MKNITVLGVTGSIGMQTVDVVKNHLDKFKIVAMSAGYNIKQVEEILEMIDVEYVCVVQKKDAQYLQEKYPDLKVTYGQEGLIKIATLPQIDIVLNAIVGFAGLVPTIEAIKAKKDIALANKETLVVAGHIITKLVKENNVRLLPVDSEHSAIFQSLNGEKHQQIKRIILTASGGSFRDKSRDELIGVTVEEALNHPNWSMGAKITIDSATLFNKGLEVIEAKWLFDVSYDQIGVLIHPESYFTTVVTEGEEYSTGNRPLPQSSKTALLRLFGLTDTYSSISSIDLSIASGASVTEEAYTLTIHGTRGQETNESVLGVIEFSEFDNATLPEADALYNTFNGLGE